MSETEAEAVVGAKIDQRIGSVEMDMLVQAALDDPRPGDIFHEMYSYGVQVLGVDSRGVHWRSFNSAEVGRGVETRERWSQSFRYGDHMPGKHTMHLLERGLTPAPAGDSGGERGAAPAAADDAERAGR